MQRPGRTAMKSFSTALLIGLTGCLLVACEREAGVMPAPMPPPTAESELVASKDFGDYVLHFNAIRTDELKPEVAKAYSITRSRNRALLNVSMVRKTDSSPGRPVPGSVSAQAVNLTGQLKNLSLREITEGDAVYYIGDVAISDGETLVFTVDATPINETRRFSVRFTRQFFTD